MPSQNGYHHNSPNLEFLPGDEESFSPYRYQDFIAEYNGGNNNYDEHNGEQYNTNNEQYNAESDHYNVNSDLYEYAQRLAGSHDASTSAFFTSLLEILANGDVDTAERMMGGRGTDQRLKEAVIKATKHRGEPSHIHSFHLHMFVRSY